MFQSVGCFVVKNMEFRTVAGVDQCVEEFGQCVVDFGCCSSLKGFCEDGIAVVIAAD